MYLLIKNFLFLKKILDNSPPNPENSILYFFDRILYKSNKNISLETPLPAVNIEYSSNLYDLLKSYSNILFKQTTYDNLVINSSELQSVDQALERLKSMFGKFKEWTNFMTLIPNFGMNKIINKSYITSNFVASLELAKNGFIEVKQNETFGNIFVKTKYL